jgi:acyl-CoA thioester hydrolase
MDDPSLSRSAYRYFLPITTRWMDNDIYGHVNNVVYYAYFDTIANHFLITRGGLDIHNGDIVGFVVNSQCSYRSAVAYPESIEGGFRVNRLGNSSVEYGVAIFREGAENACAVGTFTHVFVDRETERPTPIPAPMRAALQSVLVED